MDRQTQLTTLYNIKVGALPARIDADCKPLFQQVNELRDKGLVAATRQTADHSIYLNVTLTPGGEQKLAELRNAHPDFFRALFFRRYLKPVLKIVVTLGSGSLLALVMKFFFA